MLQRFPIRVKLFIALAVPLFALLVVAVFEVAQTTGAKTKIERQADLASSSSGNGSLVSMIEDERNAAATYLVGLEANLDLAVENLEEGFAGTDEAREAFGQDVRSQGGAVEEAFAPALDNLGELDALRAEITGFTGERTTENIGYAKEIFDRYSELMTPLFDASRDVSLEIDNPDLRRGAELIELASHQTDLFAKLTINVLTAVLSGTDGVNTPEEIATISGLDIELADNQSSIETKAAGDYRALVQNLLATPHIQEFSQLIDEALASGTTDIVQLLAAADGSENPGGHGYTIFRQDVDDQLSADADDLANAAGQRVWIYWGLALLAVVVAALATWLVSRSITRPLRALTRQATEMANHRLPDAVLDILDTPLGDDVTVPGVDPIQVQTRDEVADVADALNTVQDSALDLAVEQAVLRRNIADSFVNLGRRNQNLLGRQLDFITELEHNETDSDTLANLFRLDHLATRMRRNAESLLVLAGIDPPRKWAAPVRITDAIRAALGEVEDYQRVTVRAVEPATILGNAAADLAHLLAELIENALIFSPPDQTVEIRGRAQPTGYTLAIIDSGLGMPSHELANANRRLAGAESFTIAPSKYLGHYVAGNLAARHNINITLHSSIEHGAAGGRGITATINIPPTLLTAEPAAAPGLSPADSAPGAPQLTAPPPPVPLSADASLLELNLPSMPPDEFLPAASSISVFDTAPPPPPPSTALPAAADHHQPPGWPPSPPSDVVPLVPLSDAPPPAPPPPSALPAPPPAPAQPLAPPQPPRMSDLQLDPLPPPVDPAGAITAPTSRVQDPSPPFGPGQGSSDQPSDMPPLSAPHLRVTPGQAPSQPPSPPPLPARPLTPPPPAPRGTPRPPLPTSPSSTPGGVGPDRTSGGLVKRSPRPGSGTQPARPSEELLQTLATYTTHLHRQIDTTRPVTPPSGSGTAFPAFSPTTPPGTPTPRPGGGGAGDGGLTGRTPHVQPRTEGPLPEHTASGLARRVPGAQAPQTQLVGLRREQEPPGNGVDIPSNASAPRDNRAHPGTEGDAAPLSDVSSSDANPATSSAKDVYSFLSSFSAGVQRGLDEARPTTTPEEDQ